MTVNQMPSTQTDADQQTLLNFAVSHSPAIFYVVSLEASQPFKFISSNVETITGHPANAFMTDPAYGRRFIHPDDYPAYADKIEQLKSDGKLTHEYRFRSLHGDYRWYRDELRIAGAGREFIGCMIDINAEIEAAEKLRETEAERQGLSVQLQDAVEDLGAGLYVTDRNDKLVTVNSALARNANCLPQDLIGQDLEELARRALPNIKEFDGQAVQQTERWVRRIAEHMKQRPAPAVELQLTNERWVLISFHTTLEGGQASVSMDVTRLKDTQQRLRESESHFRKLVEANPLPVWLTDIETSEIYYASPAAAAALGHEWPTEKPHFFIGHYVDPKARQFAVDTIKRDGQLLDFETRLRRVDGSEFWVAINSRLIEYQGRDVTITGIVDLSEHKRREAELRQAQAELLESEQHFRLLVERHPLPVILGDIETGEALYESPAAVELIGGRRDPDVKYDLRGNYANPADRDRLISDVRRKGEVHNWPLKCKHRDGSTFWASVSARLVRQHDRELLLTALIDLTEQYEREEEFRRIQDELRESEQHFRMLVENHPLPVALVEVESGKILYNSPAAAELTGRGWNPGVEQNARDQYANMKDREVFVAKLREHGELLNYPTQYKHSDGSTFWISTSARLIEWQGRELHIASMVDLSEQYEREEALQRAHETLEDAIESLAEGFALYDADDRLITCNSQYRDFNLLCQDILKPGMLFQDLVRTSAKRDKYHGDLEEVEAWLEEHKANRFASYGGGFEFKQSDGRWVSYSNQPTRQGGMVVTLSDVTERKKMERALRDSEESVRTVLESSPASLTMVHAEDGQIIYESPVAQTIFRHDTAQGNWTKPHPRWPNLADRSRFLERVRSSGAVDDMDVVLRRGDGTTFPAALSSRLIEYQGDEVIISSIFDLTERLAMEEEMARQREALHQSEKMVALGELLASVAHELNNPLSVVVGQSMLLQETVDDPAVASRAQRIGTAADRCARVVKTFLAMARQRPLESRPVNLNDLIEASIEVTGYALRSSGVEVSIRLARALPAVNVDPDQLTQVFTNLIVNAEHALRLAPGQRRVWISTRYREQTNEVVVKIKDNGPGIPDDIRRRVFEPFFTTKGVGKGTGMGLAICHRILDSHGGKIKVETTPGGGASFVLQLPAMNGFDENRAEATPDEQKLDGLSILIIDDEADVAEMLTDILNNDGHFTETAANGVEALALLDGQHFDIVLSDLRMPTMDGPALFSHLQAERPELLERIAFITGDTLSGSVKDFLSSAGRPHIEKPITPQDVRDLVRRVALGENGDG